MEASPTSRAGVLTVSNLSRLGLGPVSLSLAPGTITALMGPSGAGKTMALRAIADLDPAIGEITLGTSPRDSVAPTLWRQRVVYVPANAGWWLDRVGPHFAGAGEEEVIRLLHSLGLESTALGWEVSHLSTGERQRLALARALARTQDTLEVLLLDEPTSGLDEANRALAEKLIVATANAGKAVLMVTHDRTAAGRMNAKIINIRDGKLQDGGAP